MNATTNEAPAHVWANRRLGYLCQMLRGHRDHSSMYELALYQLRGCGIRNVRGHRAGNNAAQIAALRYLLARCPLAITPGLLDVAKRLGLA